jgi:hypothetical protein
MGEDEPINLDEINQQLRDADTPTEPLYKDGRDPHGGVGALHKGIAKQVAVGRRTSSRSARPVKSVWKGTPDAPRALPLRRERVSYTVSIEGGAIVDEMGLDYTLGKRVVDVWTARNDPHPHRIDSIGNITVIALEVEPRGKKAGARTDAYIVDKPPAKGELVRPMLFPNGFKNVARVSVPWEQIRAPK